MFCGKPFVQQNCTYPVFNKFVAYKGRSLFAQSLYIVQPPKLSLTPTPQASIGLRSLLFCHMFWIYYPAENPTHVLYSFVCQMLLDFCLNYLDISKSQKCQTFQQGFSE